MQCSDPEATAWAWAIGKHLGLPDEIIILDSEYDGTGANERLSLGMGAHLGVHGLAHAGFCAASKAYSEITNQPCYPNLAFWLQY